MNLDTGYRDIVNIYGWQASKVKETKYTVEFSLTC